MYSAWKWRFMAETCRCWLIRNKVVYRRELHLFYLLVCVYNFASSKWRRMTGWIISDEFWKVLGRNRQWPCRGYVPFRHMPGGTEYNCETIRLAIDPRQSERRIQSLTLAAPNIAADSPCCLFTFTSTSCRFWTVLDVTPSSLLHIFPTFRKYLTASICTLTLN
jgi:hypothetical protein